MGWTSVDAPEEEGATELEKEQLRQAEVNYEDRKAFDPVKNLFQGAPGDPTGGLMSQNFSGYGQTRAAAEAAQSTNQQRQKMGPQNVSSGTGVDNLVGLNAARGTASGAGGGEAITKGAIGVRERQLNALGSEMGLAANISQTTSTAAAQSAERARMLAEHELSMDMNEAAGNAQLVSDMSSAYMKGASSTGEMNPFKWKGAWEEQNPWGSV